MWANGNQSQACIHRLDPKTDGAWIDTQEVCLAELASRHIGAPVPYADGAYNNILPIKDPETGEQFHIVGLEAFVAGKSTERLTATNQRKSDGGFYAGALYALRDSRGHWRLGEVGGKHQAGMPDLVSIYTYAMSPFAGKEQDRIYLGGYDPDHFPSTNTGWIASTMLTNMLTAH